MAILPNAEAWDLSFRQFVWGTVKGWFIWVGGVVLTPTDWYERVAQRMLPDSALTEIARVVAQRPDWIPFTLIGGGVFWGALSAFHNTRLERDESKQSLAKISFHFRPDLGRPWFQHQDDIRVFRVQVLNERTHLHVPTLRVVVLGSEPEAKNVHPGAALVVTHTSEESPGDTRDLSGGGSAEFDLAWDYRSDGKHYYTIRYAPPLLPLDINDSLPINITVRADGGLCSAIATFRLWKDRSDLLCVKLVSSEKPSSEAVARALAGRKAVPSLPDQT